MTNKRINLEDIAKKAGVSRSTVSRVVNEEPNVNERTRARVLAVIQSERYQPNTIARIMVKGRTNVIGVVIPNELHTVFTDPHYYPTLLSGVSTEASARDFAMLLWIRQSGEMENNFFTRIVQNGLMDGLIICSASDRNPVHEHLHEAGFKFTMVERPKRYANQISFVTVDNVYGSQLAVQHLIEMGRRRIGIVTGNMDNSDAQERYEGYRRVIQDTGMPLVERYIVNGEFNRAGAYAAMHQLLRQSPDIDAVYSCNDIMSAGVYDALREAGRRVPDDIAVVGFDDLPTSLELRPTLTSVRHPIYEKGRVAARLLLDQLEDRVGEHQHVTLPTSLAIRQSSGAVPIETVG
jgi:LacI family transcriptional regulator